MGISNESFGFNALLLSHLGRELKVGTIEGDAEGDLVGAFVFDDFLLDLTRLPNVVVRVHDR